MSATEGPMDPNPSGRDASDERPPESAAPGSPGQGADPSARGPTSGAPADVAAPRPVTLEGAPIPDDGADAGPAMPTAATPGAAAPPAQLPEVPRPSDFDSLPNTDGLELVADEDVMSVPSAEGTADVPAPPPIGDDAEGAASMGASPSAPPGGPIATASITPPADLAQEGPSEPALPPASDAPASAALDALRAADQPLDDMKTPASPISVPAPTDSADLDAAEPFPPFDETAHLSGASADGTFDEPTDDAIPASASDFNPPSIPGIRGEITRPLRSMPSGEPISEEDLPPVAAPPESSHRDRSESTEALLDDLAGSPLHEKTVDLDMSGVQHTREMVLGGEPDSASQSQDDSQTLEGDPFEEGTDVAPMPPNAGDVIKADDGASILVEESLGDQRGCVFYRARVDLAEMPCTAVWSSEPLPEPPWNRLPDPRLVRPKARASLDKACIRVFDRPKGNTVVDYLTAGDRFLPALATLELGIELAEILEGLHGAGQYIYDLDPSQIVIERGGKVRIYAVGGFHAVGTLPTQPPGVFAAPEVRRRLTYLVGAHSDVYAVALLLYALLARRAPLELDLDPGYLVSPRVFRPECPLGIWPYLRPCLVGIPGKRVGHARGLRQLLTRARDRLLAEARAAEARPGLLLEAWAELHPGLGKARRGAPQQDRAVALTDDDARIGLYTVSDGVSRSKYGDGAYAAEQVRIATQQRWGALMKAGPAALSLTHPQRVDVLRQIARSAGKRISAEVTERCAPLPNEPNQVMSATYVAAYVVGAEATIANLGDSRAYIVRDETIERIGIDHDRATDALRMGLSFKEAAEVKMGAALTRVVGRVLIDSEGRAHPDPFEPEIFRVQLLPGDRLVLCSDGIPDFASGPGADQATAEQAMLEVVLEYEDPARAAYELVVLANRGGGYDNISVIVIAAHSG